MSTATDGSPRAEEVPQQLALLDRPQPLGFLPTRRFWQDHENQRLAGPPFAVLVGVLILVINLLLDIPWWAAGLAFLGAMLLLQGLFERYIRHAAKRRFRSRPEQAALTDNQDAPACAPAPTKDSYSLRGRSLKS
jgi:hypothetical protein